MNVTWPEIGGYIGILIGVGITAYGVLSMLAAGMSDAPQEGEPGGGWLVITGVVVLIASIAGSFF